MASDSLRAQNQLRKPSDFPDLGQKIAPVPSRLTITYGSDTGTLTKTFDDKHGELHHLGAPEFLNVHKSAFMKPVKLLLVGAASVGKTCIVNRIAFHDFKMETPTVGAGNTRIAIESDDGTSVLFNVWDTAGSERYRSLTPMYFSGASVALLVYDITSEASFKALDSFVHLLQDRAPPNCKLAVVGNKRDLDGERKVSEEQGEEYAKKTHAEFFMETSAKENINITALFQKCASLPGLKKQMREGESFAVHVDTSETSSGRCC